MKYSFLTAILGIDGSKALQKAGEILPALDHIILPRCISSWINVYSAGFDGFIPGTEIGISFKKNEAGFEGVVQIGENTHTFTSASDSHLVACVVTALGSVHEEIPLEIRNMEVVRLGKSIDLLIKSYVINEHATNAASEKLGAIRKAAMLSKFEPSGGPAKPSSPTPPAAPTASAPKVSAAGKGLKPKTPSQGPKAPKKPAPTLALSEKEVNHNCHACGLTQLKKGELVGCVCFRALIKSTEFEKINGEYILKLNSDWDTDTLIVFTEAIGR